MANHCCLFQTLRYHTKLGRTRSHPLLLPCLKCRSGQKNPGSTQLAPVLNAALSSSLVLQGITSELVTIPHGLGRRQIAQGTAEDRLRLVALCYPTKTWGQQWISVLIKQTRVTTTVVQQNFLHKGQIPGCENKRGLVRSQLLPLAPCSPLATNLQGTEPTSVSSLTVHWHCLGIPAQDFSHRGQQMAFNHLKTSSNNTRLQETTCGLTAASQRFALHPC